MYVCVISQPLTSSLASPSLSLTLNQIQLWSVLRIAMETEIVSQEYATVFQDFWDPTALEVNTQALCHPSRDSNC